MNSKAATASSMATPLPLQRDFSASEKIPTALQIAKSNFQKAKLLRIKEYQESPCQ
jgi:hypothetical protein